MIVPQSLLFLEPWGLCGTGSFTFRIGKKVKKEMVLEKRLKEKVETQRKKEEYRERRRRRKETRMKVRGRKRDGENLLGKTGSD